jgi:biopolymer transport protein ExbD
MDPVTAVDAPRKEPWRAPPPRRRGLVVALVLLLAAAALAGTALAVRRLAEPPAENDPLYDDEKKLRDRAHGPPVALVPPKDLTLPEVSGGAAIAPEDLVLTVSKSMLALEGQDVVPVPADPRRGFDAKYKRSGQNDLYVQPLGMALTWARKYPPMVGRPAAMTLLVDRDVPYRLLVEILFTLGQNEWAVFHIGAMHAGKVVGLKDTRPPHATGSRASALRHGLGLTVLVVPDGFSVKVQGGNVAPGCQDVGPGLAIPKAAAGYDYAALRACAARLKTVAPEFAKETEVVLSANPDTAFGTIVSTMETLQKDDLFPEIVFGVAR